jgi:hypothetical protein
MSYWTVSLALIGFGILGAMTIGLPFLFDRSGHGAA